MDKIEKKIHITYVKTNLQLCKEIVSRAERVNKGRYAHDINQLLHIVKSSLKKLSKLPPEKVSVKELKIICHNRMALTDKLYLLAHNL